MKLSGDELRALIENAFGFLDDENILVFFDRERTDSSGIALTDEYGDAEYYFYTEAQFDTKNAKLKLRLDSKEPTKKPIFDEFTVLITAKISDILRLIEKHATH